IANPSATTGYTVTVTNQSGCRNYGHTMVEVNPVPVVNVNSATICAGASAQLNASGGTTYSWIPATGLSSSTISNPIAHPASTTTYTVTVRNASGCVNAGTS